MNCVVLVFLNTQYHLTCLVVVHQPVEGSCAVQLDAGQPLLVLGEVEVVQQPPHLCGGLAGQLLHGGHHGYDMVMALLVVTS